MNFDRVKEMMVEEQLISRGVKEPRVTKVMKRVPRHLFVEKALWERAYEDHPLPIGEEQTISQPFMVGTMTQALALQGKEKVLEIGTGSGYQTAILAELAEQVFTIERFESLSKKARENLHQLGYTNVVLRVGDGCLGWREFSPFDGILVTAGAPEVPKTLFEQMKEGGRMVIPIGGSKSQDLVLIRKKDKKMKRETLCGCVFVPLVGRGAWVTRE
ncbi:protein-L-isoaspartate(D-aspartate) O-methyltransferase [candidate division TA06 bacterium]|nr:protein-L-isoaspartate(D-aspartate) O-methyltransferase [candidate division TA06 bacterium]